MSKTAENILYIGENIQLLRAVLNLSAATAVQADYSLHHLRSTEQIMSALDEKHYSHLICDLPVSQYLVEQIAADFPLLQSTYLAPLKAEKVTDVSELMKDVVTDEVKATLDYVSIPIYFKNRTGQFLACNSYFSHLFGLTPAQVVGKTAADVLSPDLLDEIEKIDQKVFTERKVYFYECKIQDLAGGERDMVFRKECVANGKIQIGMLFDVTEINEAKSLLEKERLMLRATADISEDLIFFKDEQSRFLGCNKKFEKFAGCSEQDILGKKDAQFFETVQVEMGQAQDLDVMANNRVYSGEEQLSDANGDLHFIEMRKVPVQNQQGQVVGLIGVGRDLTAENLMQKQLKIANAVFENSKERLVVTDEQGKIISVNKALCTASSFSKSELLGANIKDFASNQHDLIEAALQKGESWQGEVVLTTKNGELYFSWLEAYLVKHPEEGIVNRIYSLTDLNQTKDVDQKIQHLAKYDPLTGLFNRIAMFARLENAISRAIHNESTMAVILVDINGFKAINDRFGNNAGDALLREIAGRLKSCVFDKDTVARFGDDEFVVIVDQLADEQDVAIVAQKVAMQFDHHFVIDNMKLNVSATIGIAICPDDGATADALIESAEIAMQRGKEDKSAACHFYTMGLTRHSNEQFELEEELKQALLLDQFELYYLPQYDLNKRQIVAVEGILYWNHPRKGRLHPENFLFLAEKSGLSIQIGLQTLRKAAKQAVTWQQSGINFGRIAINLSETQLSQSSFIADLQSILLTTNCSSQWLEFEIDEAIFRSDSPVVYENLMNIAKIGGALTVANFAEDRPILYLIEQLRIEKFKLSKSYINMRSRNPIGAAMKDAVFALTRSLGVDVVAESLGDVSETPFAGSKPFNAQRGWFSTTAMKASETTFYLRCNKRK